MECKNMINKMSLKFYYLKAFLRAKFIKCFIKKMGGNVFIQWGFKFINPNNIEIGHHVYINHNVELYAQKATIKIGNYVMIGQNTYIGTLNHGFTDWKKPMYFQKDTHENVIIEDDVWIGTKAIILPNVRIKRGAFVAAGAVVTKDIDEYSVVGGVPAKHIKYRFSEEDMKKAQKLDLSQFEKYVKTND